MDERKWLNATDPRAMLEVVRDKASDRRLRLFGCACVRRVWDLLLEEQSRRLVEVGELYADGFVDEQKLSEARQSYDDYLLEVDEGDCEMILPETEASYAACEVADRGASIFCALYACHFAASARAEGGHEQDERATQAALLRDLFGPLLFRIVTIDPTWLSWNDGIVRRLAAAIYENRCLPEGTLDVDRLAILADALEEAGCTNQDMLSHCRNGGTHVRGCWVLDAILGKS